MARSTTDDITSAAHASFDMAGDERMRQVSQALVRHLHAFVQDVSPTRGEWMAGIEFLTRVGHTCVGARQEFILLSDVLGVSMLVDALNDGQGENATESTVLGPFFVDNPPLAEQGCDLARGKLTGGDPLWIDVTIQDAAGAPLAGAVVDIWQCAPDGLYDVQRGLPEGESELRGRFFSDAEGRVRCWSTMPVSYQIPGDGPVGDLLRATNRHDWRPAHVHFRIEAAGYDPLVTHLFAAGDRYLDSDVVFGVKPSLVLDIGHAGAEAPVRDDRAAARLLQYNFILQTAGDRPTL